MMKNLFKRSLLVIALFTLLGSNAMSNDNNLNDNLIIVNGKLVDLTLKYTDGELKINIKDSFGIVLYNDIYTGVEFTKKFDLTSLPNGNYYFEIEGQTKIKMIPFTVILNNIDFQKEEETIFFKPIIRFKENVVYISKLALKKGKMKIKIYDDNSNLIYTEDLKEKLYLDRKLNLSMLESGSYNIVSKSEGKIFKEKVTKK